MLILLEIILFVSRRRISLHHGADLGYGGLHVGAGDPGHLGVGGAHQGEGHRLLHNLHVLHRGDDTSGDGSHLEVFK